jgi:hypothetical protein
MLEMRSPKPKPARRYLSTDARHGEFIMGRMGAQWRPGMSVLAVVRGNTTLGGVVYESYTGEGGSVLGSLAGVTKHWLTKDFMYCAFDFAFNTMKVRKILGHVNANKTSVLAFDFALGFQFEAEIEGVYPDGNCIIVSMTRDQCRWLEPKFRPKWLQEAA